MTAQTPATRLLQLLDAAYQRRTGKPLGEGLHPASMHGEPAHARHAWLDQHAPFGLLAHDGAGDPCFIYANACALRLFDYPRDAFLGLPSRLSAADAQQPDRQRILAEVRTHGIAFGYAGIRITRSGQRFLVKDGIIWEVEDEHGARLGQAALIWADTP
jgi:PAS domain-containing protein